MMGRMSSDFCVAAAVNSQDILESCLRRSPDIASGALALKTYEGFSSAAAALNAGLDNATAPIVVLAHQDVYLPRPWLAQLIAAIDAIEAQSPDWGVVGLSGLDTQGRYVGRVWSTGIGREVGDAGFAPTRATTMDELVLIVRRASGLRFDEGLPGFHLYATDIVLMGAAQQKPAFVVHAPVVHNSRAVRSLGGAYALAYHHMRRKWRTVLPVRTLICDITASGLPLLRSRFRRWKARPKMQPDVALDAVDIARRLGYE